MKSTGSQRYFSCTPPRINKLYLDSLFSRSPKAGHNKVGRSDFRSQRLEPDTGKMQKVPLTQEKQGSQEIPLGENAENTENSGVAPANQTEEREVRELFGKESGICSGTPFIGAFV